MTEINLIDESIKFMMLGMGIVFIFLYVMVLVVKAQHYIINKYFPQTPQVTEVSKNTQNKAKITAAIVAAIQYHNKGK